MFTPVSRAQWLLNYFVKVHPCADLLNPRTCQNYVLQHLMTVTYAKYG